MGTLSGAVSDRAKLGVRPLLVVGSPRSGATLIGALLGSGPRVVNIGEYFGYYFCHRVALSEIGGVPTVEGTKYLAERQRYAHDFPKRQTEFSARAGWAWETPSWLHPQGRQEQMYGDPVFPTPSAPNDYN